MQSTNIQLKKVYEHDMDLLILEEFVSNNKFAKLFLDKLNLPDDYIIEQALHSYSDEDGESDLTFVLKYPDKTVVLMIEDKIDATTMTGQSQRYHLRAQRMFPNGEYYIMLAAPEDYHREHATDVDADYDYRITYEELHDYFQTQTTIRSRHKLAVIETALREKKAGYQVNENQAVTEFWKELRRYTEENYRTLEMAGKDTPKGSSAVWPEFYTALRNVKVIYKSQKGYVDLEFPNYGDRIGDLHKRIAEKQPSASDSAIYPTGKAASIRIANVRWIVDFKTPFDDVVNIIDDVLQAVKQLCELAEKLNYSDLY